MYYSSPILAGKYIYHFTGGQLYDSEGKKNLTPKLAVNHRGPACVIELSTGKRHDIMASHIDRRFAEDSEYALRNRYVSWGWFGSNASPYAQANRLFFRTKGVLYCIGDPKQPFPVPKDCPPQGRVQK
jgi:hypothetical protein